eukprot:g30642.t1
MRRFSHVTLLWSWTLPRSSRASKSAQWGFLPEREALHVHVGLWWLWWLWWQCNGSSDGQCQLVWLERMELELLECECTVCSNTVCNTVFTWNARWVFVQRSQFKQWSIFLPQLVCEKVSLNSTYTIMRQQRNPAFFQQMRERLQLILQDCDLLQVSGQICSTEGLEKDGASTLEALQIVLQALLAALGFLGNRHFYKAFILGELCMQVADRITAGIPGETNCLDTVGKASFHC